MDITDLLNKIINEPKKLSDSQRDAVLSDKGHIRIVAGAGAGKTETLTRKIVYLLFKKDSWECKDGVGDDFRLHNNFSIG